MLDAGRKGVGVIGMVCICFSIAFAYSGGTGEPNNPYQIADVNDLLALGGTPEDYNKCFILTSDIDLSWQEFTTAIIAPDTNSDSGFQGTAFTGIFDGNGYKITNFTINGNSYLGLFGNISADSKIKNLGIEDCNIKSFSSGGSVLAGMNSGNISYCHSTGKISGSCGGGLVGVNLGDIRFSYSTCDVTAQSLAGGLVVSNMGIISNCYSTGPVKGLSSVVGLDQGIGGLAGNNIFGIISDCYSTGIVSGYSGVGGLIGTNDEMFSVINSFWDVNTSGQTNSAGGTGKTTEQMQDINTFLAAGWDFVGETDNGTCNYWQMLAGCYPVFSYMNGYIPPKLPGSGTDNDPYIITDANDMGTIWYRPSAHYVLANDINLAGIKWSMAVVPEFNGKFNGKGFCVKNLLINGIMNYLGLFGEITSGGSIKNLGIEDFKIDSTYHYVGGLAGAICHSTISNCFSKGEVSGDFYVGGLIGNNNSSVICDCYSNSDVNVALCCICPGRYLGGLVGYNDCDIINCYSTGSLKGIGGVCGGGLVGENQGNIRNCYSTVTVISNDSMGSDGGLVGANYGGNINDCYSTGNISGSNGVGGLAGNNSIGGIISDCYSTGAASGISYVGGLVGDNEGIINNCYSTGDAITGDSSVGGLVGDNYGNISNCYSTTGTVSGNLYVGGLVGFGSGTRVVSSFWDVNTSGQTESAGGEGKTTEEMQTLSTYTNAGWDFSYEDGDDADWFIQIDEYPILTWQISPADLYTDGKNNFKDFAVFAEYWLRKDCRVYNDYCDWADLNFDGSVDYDDLIELMSYWLENGIYE